MLYRFRQWLRMLGLALPHALRRGFVLGYCSICQARTIFFMEGAWLRDQFRCARCMSIPRWRAMIFTLEEFVPQWRQFAIHESSPGGAASDKLARECVNYTAT